jgi:hypothetical protein
LVVQFKVYNKQSDLAAARGKEFLRTLKMLQAELTVAE